MTIAELFRQNWQPNQWIDNPILKNWLNSPEIVFFLLMLLFTLLALLGYAHRRPWQYGLITPAGKDWLTPLPLGVLCGIAGGVLLQTATGFGSNPLIEYTLAFLLAPLAMELLFRSLAHGLLAQTATIQDSQSSWFLSWPNLAAAILYAFFISFNILYNAFDYMEMLRSWVLAKHFLAALGFGLVAGIMRERSQSVLTAYMLHITTISAHLLIYEPMP